MSTGPRQGVFLLLLLSATLLSNLASAELGTVDHRPSLFSAQIAHHTELPYIRDPPEHPNDVHEPLPETNNEANEIHAADGLGVPDPLRLPEPSNAGSAAASLVVRSSTRSTTTLTPYDPPKKPLQYHAFHKYDYRRPTPRPYSFERAFKCDFEKHTCGMRNQENMGKHFQPFNGIIADRNGSYMAVNAQRVPAGVSRLITPYLPGYPNSMVCLRLTYLVHGPGAERIQVVAQDVGNRPLFSLERLPDFAWRTFAINMTIHQDVRFFIEAYTNAKPGIIAFDDFTYSLFPCR